MSWTWREVMLSEPDGGTAAARGFTELAGTADELTSVLTDLARVPWEGPAADAFRDYLAGLRRSAAGAQAVAEDSATAAGQGAAGLTGLLPAAEETAELLNAFIARSAEIRDDGVGLGDAVELVRMRAEATAALERVRGQRDDLMSALGTAAGAQTDALLDYRTPPPPDASVIDDPVQRSIVQGLADEVSATLNDHGSTERSRELIEQLNATDSDLMRRMLLIRAADELSAAELDHLIDNVDPDLLADALGSDWWLFGPSPAAQRELFNSLAKKLDLDTLTGLADLVPDNYWHPDPFKHVPGIGEDFNPDGWNLSWVPLPEAGTDVTAETIDQDDIQQRGLGDCHLQAALYSIASTEQGRQHLADNIQLNDNGTYTVTLYDRDGNPVPVVVTPDTPVASTDDGWTSTYDANQALWVQLYEKAVAQSNEELAAQEPLDRAGQNEHPGYPGINGGWPQENLSRITGNEPVNMDNSLGLFDHARLAAAEQSGAPITVTFHEDYTGSTEHSSVVGAHVYSVERIDWSQDPPMVELRNPWGHGHATMTLDELQQTNGYITVGSV